MITSASGQSLNLATGANLDLTTGAILKSGTDAYTISSSGGILRSGATGTGTELIAHVDGGALTISANLATAIVGIAKGGTGDLILSGTRAGTLSGAIGIGGGNLEFQGSTTIVTGLISGSGGLIANLNAGQLLNLKNTGNTFSGQVLIKGGMLSSGDAYNTQGLNLTSYNGLNNIEINGGTLGVPYHFGRYLGSGDGQIQITGGTSGFTAYGGAPDFQINGSSAYEVVWGSPYFQPTTLVLNDVQANSVFDFKNKIDLNGSTRTVAVNSTTQAATISGVIRNSSGTAGLTKTGNGTLILSAANTYNGNTSVDQGTLTTTVAAALSGYNSAGKVIFNGGTVGVRVGGAGWTTGQVDTLLSNATKTSGFLGIDTTNGSLAQWTAFTTTNLGSALGLTKLGANTLTLDQANTYTGATTVREGALSLTGSLTGGTAISTSGSAIFVQGATSAITGAASFTQGSTGTSILSGTNNYSGLTTVSDGRLWVTNPGTLGGLTIAAGKSFIYAPTSAGALNIGGAYTLGAATAMNTALGGTASQSVTAVTGAASLSGTGVVNIYGIPGVATATGTHNLITAASGLTGGAYTLGTVYNNTDFTVSGFTRSATDISVTATSAAALTTAYWKGGLAGNTGVWAASNGSTQSNWQVTDTVNQPLAPGAAADLVFSTATSPGTMAGMTLGANMEVKSLTINNTATAFGLSDPSGFALTIGTGGITMGAGVQAATISTPVTLGASQSWTNNSGNTLNANGALNLGANTLTFGGNGNVTFGTVAISGTGGSIIKNGSGLLRMNSATHSYTGTTTINGGTVMLGGAKSAGNYTLNNGMLTDYYQATTVFTGGLGAGDNQIQIYGDSGFGGGNGTSTWRIGASNSVLQWGSTYFNPTSLKFMAPGADNMGPSIHGLVSFNNGLDLNGAVRTINVQSTSATPYSNAATISGAIINSTGTSGLTKTGPGSLILTGTNTFNGTTTSLTKNGAGTQTLSGANSYTGATIINAGNLTLAVGSGGSLSASSSLTMGGGTLQLTGTGTQTVNGLTTTASTGSRIVLAANETLTLGALTSAGAGSALNFNTAAGGADADTTTVGTSLITLTGGTMLNSWTVSDSTGFGLATRNGSNQIIRDITTILLPASLGVSSTNYRIDNNGGGGAGSSSLAVTASQSAGSITVDTSANSGALTLNSTVVLSNNIWNFGGTGSNTYEIANAGGGAAGTGIRSAASGNTITFNNYNGGAVTIASPIIAFGANPVIVNGTGTTVFSGTNTFTGATTVNGGTLRLANAAASGTNGGGIAVQNGASLELSGGNTFVADTLSINGTGISNGGALRNFSGINTYQGAITIGSGGARINSDADGALTLSGGVVTSQFNDVTFGGAGNTTVSTVAISGAGRLTQDGAGTTTLTATNTYTGATTISQGTLSIGTVAAPTGSINNSAVTVNGGTFRYNSSVAYSGTLTFTSGTIAGTNLTGSLGGQTIGAGQTIAPGDSPGTLATTDQTWANGGSYAWEVNNATGTAGADPGWDLETGSGTLTITAGSGSEFNLLLTSLDALNAAGLATNFNDALSYNWLIADFASITDFAANAFNIDTTGFSNTFTGNFGVSLGGGAMPGDNSQIYLTYVTAVPEPGAALIGSLGLLALLRRRRS